MKSNETKNTVNEAQVVGDVQVVEDVQTNEVQMKDMKVLEKDYNGFIVEMDNLNTSISANMNMEELDEIGESIIEAKQFLSSFASGEKKSTQEKALNQLSGIPLIGKWAKSKAEDIQVQSFKDSSVQEVLEGIFNSFNVKKERLKDLAIMMTGMQENLTIQNNKLNGYIEDLNIILHNTTDVGDKMTALELSNSAMAQQQITQDLQPAVEVILELMGTLHQKITKALPTIKNTLNKSLNIVGTINSIRDAVQMMNTLEDLTNEITQKSTNTIQDLTIEVMGSLSEGTNIEYYKDSAKRAEEHNKLLLETKKKYIEQTVKDYETLSSITADTSNRLEDNRKKEMDLLENNLETMKGIN